MVELIYDAAVADRLQRNVDRALIWATTDQGYDFWRNLRRAFCYLKNDDELEFEKYLETAIKYYRTGDRNEDVIEYKNTIARKIVADLQDVFDWSTVSNVKFWKHLYTAFYALSCNDVEGFNRHMHKAVESYE